MVDSSDAAAIVWGAGDVDVNVVFWAAIGGEMRRKFGFKATHGEVNAGSQRIPDFVEVRGWGS